MLELNAPHIANASGGGNCIEVVYSIRDGKEAVLMFDTKIGGAGPDQPHLTFTRAEWVRLLTAVAHGALTTHRGLKLNGQVRLSSTSLLQVIPDYEQRRQGGPLRCTWEHSRTHTIHSFNATEIKAWIDGIRRGEFDLPAREMVAA
jgi:hypothetical protein